MSLYTVHVPGEAPDAMTRGEQTRFIREGFNVAAFVFGLFYLLAHRLWAAAAAWVVLTLALAAFGHVFHPPFVGLLALALLMHVYAGVEGPDLRRWGLAQRGYVMRDIVSAPDLDTAEAMFFTNQPEAIRPVPATSGKAARFMGPAAVPAVIGLFPDEGGRA